MAAIVGQYMGPFQITKLMNILIMVMMGISAMGLSGRGGVSETSGMRGVGAVDTSGVLGACWGRVAHQTLPPARVVKMLQANKITKVKLFNSEGAVLTALANSDIEVMVMVVNDEIEAIALDLNAASGWVYRNIIGILPTGVNIKYISVGNEPFLAGRHDYDDFLFPAVENMYEALKAAKLDDTIKVTVSFNSEILSVSSPPSSGEFHPIWVNQISNITSLIQRTNSVFSVNIYPFFSLKGNSEINEGFVFFDSAKPSTLKDNGKVYNNILDASLDAVFTALAKIGFPNVEVIIGEAGWPSDGHPIATVANAARYNQGLVKHLMSGKGTPLRPNTLFTTYLFSLLDEDAKGIDAGAFERRWGIFDDFGNPKFALDLSGGGSTSAQISPVPGIISLSKKWCVVDTQRLGGASGVDAVAKMQSRFQTICKGKGFDFGDKADCTPVTSNLTSPGLMCGRDGTLVSNLTYVLNAYYQVSGQDDNVCTQGGIGRVTRADPSTGSCKFFVGLNLKKMSAYDNPDKKFSWPVLAYIMSLILGLASFL